MPCYNEETCLASTATELVQAFAARSIPFQLVLVDNGSRDHTGEVIDDLVRRGLPITKVTVAVNIGYGHGILEGMKQCVAPLVGYLCADGQVAASEAVATYDHLCAATVPALAKVRRRIRQDSWRRKFVSACYNFGIPMLFGWLGTIDLNASPKILPREALLTMRLESKDWFLDPELMIKAKHLGLRVLEHDAESRPRAGGKSNVRYTTCLEFLRNIARFRFGKPLRAWKDSLRREEAATALHPVPAPTVGRGSRR
jgi:glycosyltransferase involved in cell wall biosynthesis